MRHLCVFALLSGVFCCGQPAGTKGDDVKSWLRFLDTRIYTPPDLKALAFTFRPQVGDAAGAVVRPAKYLVSYRWRRGVGDRVDLLGHGSKVLERVPGYTAAQHTDLLDSYQLIGRNFAAIVKGMSLSRQYADWRGRVVKKTVNNGEEVSLILEPKNPVRVTHVTMYLNRKGIPWKTDKVYKSGDRFTQHHEYDKRDEGYLITKLQRIHTPAHPRDIAFDSAFILTWHRVGGILLPAAIEKVGKRLPPSAKGKTVLSEMQVNDDVLKFEARKIVPKKKKK
ncbi:MAG: hypothetical protein CMJ83_22655 [Planctomycetes bacterium]|nr:hypothetical protein [Planctomycetota bacterium]